MTVSLKHKYIIAVLIGICLAFTLYGTVHLVGKTSTISNNTTEVMNNSTQDAQVTSVGKIEASDDNGQTTSTIYRGNSNEGDVSNGGSSTGMNYIPSSDKTGNSTG